MRMNRNRPIGHIRVMFAAVALLAGFGIAYLLDQAVFRAIDWPRAEREDWHRMLRVLGFVPLWIIAGIIVALLRRNRDWSPRGASAGAIGFYVALAPIVAGLLAEPLKMLFRRERPNADEVRYVFRAWSEETFSTSGLGLPSSHVMVAFAGATALSIIAPRASLVWFLLAAGCAFTRLADRAHWLSDVYVGAALGFLVAWLLARVMGVRPQGSGR